MNKLRKLFFAALMLTVLAPAFSANASDVITSESEHITLETIETRSSVIVYKFRSYKGRPQYRRWNETTGRWVDPAWINLT